MKPDFSKVKPYPSTGDVKPYPSGPLEMGRIEKGEAHLTDFWAKEYVDINGTEVEYYAQHTESTETDPLYGETGEVIDWQLYKIKAYVAKPQTTTLVSEQGARTLFEAQAWIPRSTIEQERMPPPTEGDVLRFWDNQFFNDQAVDGQEVPNAGLYFDVVDVDDDGHFLDGSHYVGFQLTLKRRTEFTPERRVEAP